ASVNVGIQVKDSLGDSIARNFTLNIYALQITANDVLPAATFGAPYSYSFTATPSGSYTFSTSTSLGGLSLSPSGVLSGTPNTIGPLNVTITAYNNSTGAVVTRTFTLFI